MVLGLIIGGSIGCAGDVITYSKQSHQRGDQLYAQGQYADAAGAYRNATRQNPRNYQAYFDLGNCYMQMGQHQQAIGAYKTSLDVQKSTFHGKSDEAFRHQALNELAGAIARSNARDVETDLAAQNAARSTDGEASYLLAKIHLHRGDADSAIEAYNRAMLLSPTNFLYAKEYGLYLEQLNQLQAAATPLRKAYGLRKDDQEVVAALRRIGIVPGPSLRDEADLAQPYIPKGPIRPIDFNRHYTPAGSPSQEPAPEPSYAPAPGGTVQAPRD
jgi:tetratricopeptide (TPR) repeat protein